MRYKDAHHLIKLFIFFIFPFVINVTAQTLPTDGSRIKNFGWSLRQFETHEEKSRREKQDKKEHKVSPNAAQFNNSQIANSSEANGNQNPESRNKQFATTGNEETIRVETNLVINDVLVVNKAQAITNLQVKDFIITEDGIEQKPELLSFGDSASLPRSIVLILNNGRLYANNHKNNVRAAQSLIDKLAPQDRMAIVTTDLQLILDFTRDKELLKKTLVKISPLRKQLHGETRDYGTLMAVLAEIFDENDVRPIVIFQTNGEEVYGLKKDKDAPAVTEQIRQIFAGYAGERGYGFSDVMERVKKSRVTIYSICPNVRFIGVPQEEQLKLVRETNADFALRLGVKEPQLVDRQAGRKMEINQVNDVVGSQIVMTQVAQMSGGYIEFIEKSEDTEKVYNTIFAVINNRYTIGYYSTNQAQDGKERNVKIEVRGHPEYTILHRKNYLPPAKEK